MSSSHVRGKISMRRAAHARTKQNVEAEHQDDSPVPSIRPSARTLVESKRNKRATRARMQNNAPRRARPSRRNPSPHLTSPNRGQIDESIHFGPGCTRVLAFRARNPAERLNSTVDGRRETRSGGEREKESVTRGGGGKERIETG